MTFKLPGCVFVAASLMAPAVSATVLIVDARTMIYAAAGNGIPDAQGIVPPTIELPVGTERTLSISSVIGTVSPGAGVPEFGADGGNFLNLPYHVWAYGGVAGILDTSIGYTMPLVGLFTAGTPLEASRPTDRNVTVEKNLLFMPTVLNQPFFIGDGVTSTGDPQSFMVPPGATHLSFGFADAVPTAAIFNGPPGFYSDNTGFLAVNYSIVPEPSVIALLVGSLLLAGRSRSASTSRRALPATPPPRSHDSPN